MSMCLRSWASALVPHCPQPTTSAVVSIVMTTSSAPSAHAQNPEPVESQKRFGQAITVGHRRGLPSS